MPSRRNTNCWPHKNTRQACGQGGCLLTLLRGVKRAAGVGQSLAYAALRPLLLAAVAAFSVALEAASTLASAISTACLVALLTLS